jgi:hypothetical protein
VLAAQQNATELVRYRLLLSGSRCKRFLGHESVGEGSSCAHKPSYLDQLMSGVPLPLTSHRSYKLDGTRLKVLVFPPSELAEADSRLSCSFNLINRTAARGTPFERD